MMFSGLADSRPATSVWALPDRAAWDAWRASLTAEAHRGVEAGHLRFPFPVPLRGQCHVCDSVQDMPLSGRHARIMGDGSIAFAWSEAAVCQGCGLNSRMRAAVEMLAAALQDCPAPRIYLTEQTTPLFARVAAWAAARGGVARGSEWLGADVAPGTVRADGIEHQDIHRLTHADGAFDAVLCLDVLEHVPDPQAAMAELVRVLAPGGRAIVTFPFFPDRDSTVTRSALRPDGTIDHLLPAQYHGNPLGGGSLVFSELAWDMVAAVQARAAARGDLQARFVTYWSLYARHFGPHRFALILDRDGRR